MWGVATSPALGFICRDSNTSERHRPRTKIQGESCEDVHKKRAGGGVGRHGRLHRRSVQIEEDVRGKEAGVFELPWPDRARRRTQIRSARALTSSSPPTSWYPTSRSPFGSRASRRRRSTTA